MGLIDFISRRPDVYKLRKEYDRLRENAEKVHEIEHRLEILRMLDKAEPSIMSLERHHMSDYEKKKVHGHALQHLKRAKSAISSTKKSKQRNAFKNSNNVENNTPN